jgi:hypothetical protein
LGGTISHEPVVSSLRLGSRQPYLKFFVCNPEIKESLLHNFLHPFALRLGRKETLS